MVLGHEAAGVIEEVGPEVFGLAPGDHVVLSPNPQCGLCFFCERGQPNLCEAGRLGLANAGLLDGTPRFSLDGVPVHQFVLTGSFAEATVVPAIGVTKISPDASFPAAALIGCAVATGFGAATNNADIQPGDSVVVIGCGGIGMNVIQGARMKRAERIIAVDLFPSKLALSKKFGATHVIDASKFNPVDEVLEITEHRGADVSFEAIGSAATVEQAILMIRRGGQVVLIGGAPQAILKMSQLAASEKRVVCSAYGGTNIRRDIPRYIELYQEGKLLVDEFIDEEIELAQVNDAFATMRRGEAARSVIVFS
jgi:Zn-dependent alcohol dehydrogenase